MAGRPRLTLGKKGPYNLSRIERKKREAKKKIKDSQQKTLDAKKKLSKLQDQQKSLNTAKKLMEKGGLALEDKLSKLPKHVRKAICEAAVRMVQNANYQNAGTVEFIVDKDHNFYFIEVNARIQVEHPVSEMVTGIDLIEQQIRVASGEKLPFKQKEIPCNGVAIECRINAEDATKNFMPMPGRIDEICIPGGMGVRFDICTEGRTLT